MEWPFELDVSLWVGPTSGLMIALSGCWLFLRRFERLQDQMFVFFRQELHDCQARYTALVMHLTKQQASLSTPSSHNNKLD